MIATSDFGSLITLFYSLLPLIFLLMVIGMLKKGGKRLSGLGYMMIGASLILGLLSVTVPGVAAAADCSPGSTNTIMSMPVQESFSGLTPSSTYTLYDETDGNSSTTLESDSAGVISLWITPTEYGNNYYALRLGTSGLPVLEFAIDNMDVVPFLLPVVTIAIIMMLVGAIKKGF